MNTDEETLRTNWTLVAKLKNPDDQEAWEQFYALYRGLIVGVAIKAGLRPDEAEDVLQVTTAEVSRNLDSFKAGPRWGSFHAWLLQKVHWRIQDQLNKRLPTAVSGSDAASATGSTPIIERVPSRSQVDLAALCDAEWEAQLRRVALDELQKEVKAEHYQIYHLLAAESKPVAEVARMLGRNRAQVYLIKHRVARKLEAILKRLHRKCG